MCKGLGTLPATCLKSAKDIKHKLGFILQKTEAQVAAQKQTKDKTDAADKIDAAEKRLAPADELEKWTESFSSLMTSDRGRKVFTSFLRSEFSEENMAFWVACQGYKKTSPSKMATRAKLIYQQYVEADSPNEVNLDSATREETRQNLEFSGLSCFDEAQRKIYTLMEKDSYRRFLNSKVIRDLSQTHTFVKVKKNNIICPENRKTLTGGA